MASLGTRIKSTRFYYLYNLRDTLARGRATLLASSALTSLASALTTGMFYTTFLVNNGINLVNIGILTFIPNIACCFSVLSPVILERIQKRKWVLAAMRLGYYLFFMLGVTVVPKVVQEPGLKTVLFVLTVFFGQVLNAISSSGFSSWHVNFLPDEVRAEHFGINSAITSTLSLGFGVVFSMIADHYAGTPYSAFVIELFRYLGVAFGVLDVLLLTLPTEFPYARTRDRIRFRDVFVKPVKNKKFLGCILLYAMWSYCNNLPAGVLNYYLLEDLGLKYTYIQVINVIYPLTIFIFLIPSRRSIRKCGWLGTFSIGCLLVGISYLVYGFAAPTNYLIIYPVVRLAQHVLGAHFTDTPVNNLAYLNLPDEDRTNYMSFHVLAANAAAFLGVMSGTWFVALAPDFQIHIFDIPVGHCQMLLFIQGFGILILALLAFLNRKKLSPETT